MLQVGGIGQWTAGSGELVMSVDLLNSCCQRCAAYPQPLRNTWMQAARQLRTGGEGEEQDVQAARQRAGPHQAPGRQAQRKRLGRLDRGAVGGQVAVVAGWLPALSQARAART